MDNVSSGMDLTKITHALVHYMCITVHVFNCLSTLFNGNHMGYDVSTHLFAPALTVYLLKDLFALLVLEQDSKTLVSWEES